MVVLTTSPAGLGHTRVTEALVRGLPKGIRAEVLGIEDKRIQFLHRITSTNSYLRHLTEFGQNHPYFESAFTNLYRNRIRSDTNEVFRTISDLVKRRRPKPEALLIISTHFSLAHKIAEVKARLTRELKLCVMLCVVVTDDSPQKVWGVYGADYIFVPSEETRKSLTDYLVSLKVPVPTILVCPYPISPNYSVVLSNEEFEKRKVQLKPIAAKNLRIIIPISGAAVQLKFFKETISYLDRKKKAEITLVSRDSGYTKEFLRWCQEIPSVEVVADKLDKEVVASYEREIEKNVFSVEITKPSEQAFKALVTPRQRGGMLILFSEPVGRQENDNLNFLAKHGLLPSSEDKVILHRLSYSNNTDGINQAFLDRARGWRGLLLPSNGIVAGRAILRLRRLGILESMVNFKGFSESRELRSDGVKRFWRKLAKQTRNQCSFLF